MTRLFIGSLLACFFALTGGCGHTPKHIQLVGKWEVTSMEFPDNPAGQAVQKETEFNRKNLIYEFNDDRTYFIYSEKLPDGVEGEWMPGHEDNAFFFRVGTEIAALVRCEREQDACRNCIKCVNYNPEMGNVTLHLKPLKK